MTDVLHLGALFPAAVGACCTVGGRRGAVELGSALIMLAAMLDLASGAGIVHPLVWALVLVALAIVSAVRLRAGRRASGSAGAPAEGRLRHRTAMVVHTSGGLLIMAALVCAMAGHAASRMYADSGMHPSAHHGSGISLGSLLIAVAIAGYVALSARLAVAAAARGGRLVAVELGSMALSVVAMGVAAVL